MEGHERHGPSGTVVQMEEFGAGGGRIEPIGPRTLEVDRVDQVHDDFAGNHLGNDVLDATLCRGLDPLVDPHRRRRAREIEFGHLGVEGLSHGVQEVRMHREAQPGPYGVADRGLDGGIEADQEVEQGLVGGVDLFLSEAAEPEHVAHLVPGLPRRSVHGHPERHRRRERGKEDVGVGAVGLREQVEREPVARPDDLALRRAQGAR